MAACKTNLKHSLLELISDDWVPSFDMQLALLLQKSGVGAVKSQATVAGAKAQWQIDAKLGNRVVVPNRNFTMPKLN